MCLGLLFIKLSEKKLRFEDALALCKAQYNVTSKKYQQMKNTQGCAPATEADNV